MNKRLMHQMTLLCASTTLCYLTVTSHPAFASGEHDMLSSKIGPADATKTKSILSAKDWMNPFLIVQTDNSVIVITGGTKKSSVKLAELKGFLLKLPISAWPYGRIVALTTQSIRSGDAAKILHDDRVLGETDKTVQKLLKSLSVEAKPWPSG